MTIKAVGFDFFGTLVVAKAEVSVCIDSMCDCLRDQGYNFSKSDFLSNYQAATMAHRITRNMELREVNNCVWVSDTLNRMGYETKPSDQQVLSVVESYFNPWKIELMPNADWLLENIKSKYMLMLISNFTDSTFLNKTLQQLGLARFFKHVIVSEVFGWRKPHPTIFKRFLELSNAKPEETVFIGDDLEADIKGAKELGIKTVYLETETSLKGKNLATVPDFTVKSLTEISELLLSV
jgi:putative hydrolase of the HAD superfamily